eukprot:533920-Rhodomonas_salina.1
MDEYHAPEHCRGVRTVWMWTLLADQEKLLLREPDALWTVLTWRRQQLRAGMKTRWTRVATLMQGQKIARNKGWWSTGNSYRVATRDHLDLWAPTGVSTEQGVLRTALKAMDEQAVTGLLVWGTVHTGWTKEYFAAGQAAHLSTQPSTVMCTGCSVHLHTLDNGHMQASLGAEMAFRAGDGVDWGEAVTGRANAYQAEGKACVLGIERVMVSMLGGDGERLTQQA